MFRHSVPTPPTPSLVRRHSVCTSPVGLFEDKFTVTGPYIGKQTFLKKVWSVGVMKQVEF